MENKIQELTQKLYEEGLSKGKAQAEALVAQARQEAEEIRARARQEAQALLQEAEVQAQEMAEKTRADVRIGARHSLTQLKQEIQDLVLTQSLRKPLTAALDDVRFLQEVILQLAAAFNPQGSGNLRLEVALPEDKQQALKDLLSRNTRQALDSGLRITTDKGLETGFSIAPQGSGYKLRFTEEDFENLFRQYLRPQTEELLFGQEG